MLDRRRRTRPSLGQAHHPTPGAQHARQPASPKQLNHLKALAVRTGQTFAWPNTARQASDEIARLKRTPPSTSGERAIEQFDDRAAREAAQDAVAIHGCEVVGYGSNCRWPSRLGCFFRESWWRQGRPGDGAAGNRPPRAGAL